MDNQYIGYWLLDYSDQDGTNFWGDGGYIIKRNARDIFCELDG